MTKKTAVYTMFNTKVLVEVQSSLADGFIAVLIGVSGAGKSVLATKALPSAHLISSIDSTSIPSTENMDSDLIGEELYNVSPDKFIRSRNQAIALGHKVIVTGQVWQDVAAHLAGLDTKNYRIFDLNKVWEVNGIGFPNLNTIPDSATVYYP